ncbi:PEP-CTERM sorting domain-containing protein [Niveibacterium sp. SC-1]|uniref:PEP-CTERM sorting domain-containing protein n=1 Tax=Niveibacterium sp. SC-1 TaxID=3135646 RepID=UPI00311E6ECA
MEAKKLLRVIGLAAGLLVAAPAWAQATSGARIALTWGGNKVAGGSDPVKLANHAEGSGVSGLGIPYSMSASASADLAKGELKGSALASAWDHAIFQATIFDRIVISGAPSSTVPLGISFAVDGSGDLDDVGDSNREFKFKAQLTTTVLANDSDRATSSYAHKWGLYTFNVGGNEIFESIPTGEVEVLKNEKSFFDVVLWNWLDVAIGPTGESAPIDVQWWMDGDASGTLSQGGGVAFLDVANTGHAGIVLPTGYSYTSDSGVLLTGVSAVPEPPTYALLPLGALLILFYKRRRACRVA